MEQLWSDPAWVTSRPGFNPHDTSCSRRLYMPYAYPYAYAYTQELRYNRDPELSFVLS